MKRIILGIIVGLILFVVFVFAGGSEYLIKFGQKTEKAGERLQSYEKKIKKDAEKIVEGSGKAAKDIVEGAKKAAKKATDDAVEEAVEKTTESAKESIKKVVDDITGE
ncbi:MAG: hypothetical protein KAT46_03970 [Deltaproteobacteria bacterium]|nr:hypothetical protein [Deltaproteobacteria bacterium]